MWLGLLIPDGDGFRFDWATFNQPAPTTGPSFDAPDPREHPLFREAAAIDLKRAERALELLDTGHYGTYDVETHFSAVFRDLAYVRGDDYPLLKAKVYRHRNRPPGPSRWRNTWKAFQYELRRRVIKVRGAKRILSFGETASADCTLTLDLDQQVTGRVLAVRVVSRVEWPWYLETDPSASSTVRLELRSAGRILFARQVTMGDAEVRCALHPEEWCGAAVSLELVVRSERPLPGAHVEAWLEARVRR